MGRTKERRYLLVASPFIDWAHTQNDPRNAISLATARRMAGLDWVLILVQLSLV